MAYVIHPGVEFIPRSYATIASAMEYHSPSYISPKTRRIMETDAQRRKRFANELRAAKRRKGYENGSTPTVR